MQAPMLPGTELEVLDVLGGSQRSVVRRVRVGYGTLILKEYRHPGDGWVRESAALSVMPRGAPAPRLVAERATPPAVAMSDAGPGGSVADALLGDDPVRASAAVVAWATAIGTMHRVTTGLREPFRQALTARNAYRGQDGRLAGTGDVPQPDRVVGDSGREGVAVSGIGEPVDVAGGSGDRRSDGAGAAGVGEVPQSHGAVGAAFRQCPSVGSEGDRVRVAVRPGQWRAERGRMFGTAHVPQVGGGVGRGDRDGAAGRADRHEEDEAGGMRGGRRFGRVAAVGA